MALSWHTFAQGMDWAQPPLPPLPKIPGYQVHTIAKQIAQQAQIAATQAQYNSQMNAMTGLVGGLGGTGGVYNQATTSTTIFANFAAASTTNAVTYGQGQVSQPDHWQSDLYSQAKVMAEEILERRLARERQMLLKWQRMALLPKLNFVHHFDQHSVMEMPPVVREVEGYLLQSDKTYVLPDGSVLTVDPNGNYGINDESAKVIYQACRRREFNPYLNASDLLVAFVKEVGTIDGVNQDEVLRLPIEAFINWLVLQAATKDGDSIKDLPTVKDALRICSPRATEMAV